VSARKGRHWTFEYIDRETEFVERALLETQVSERELACMRAK
jgi:Uri superfamily endonuclease